MRPRGHVTRVGGQEAENRSEGSGVIAQVTCQLYD